MVRIDSTRSDEQGGVADLFGAGDYLCLRAADRPEAWRRAGGRRVNTWQAPAYRVSHTYCVQICVQAILTIQCIDRRGCIYWSRPSDLNRRPFDYESNALPTELGRLEWWKLPKNRNESRISEYTFPYRVVSRKSRQRTHCQILQLQPGTHVYVADADKRFDLHEDKGSGPHCLFR